jgi:hypothetical protein
MVTKTVRIAAHLGKLKRNSKKRTRGLRMKDISTDRTSVSTRAGKNEAIQKLKIISPIKARTFMRGLLEIEGS